MLLRRKGAWKKEMVRMESPFLGSHENQTKEKWRMTTLLKKRKKKRKKV